MKVQERTYLSFSGKYTTHVNMTLCTDETLKLEQL